MFVINEDLSIYVTRGDAAVFSVTCDNNGVNHVFKAGDVVRLKVYGKKDATNVVLQKDFHIFKETEVVAMYLSEHDTKFGDVISKPTDYWYEVELNPYTDPQTLIGYDEDGAKVFKLFPEGADVPEIPVDPEVVKVMDDELDLTSNRPVENRAVARAVAKLDAATSANAAKLKEQGNTLRGNISDLDSQIAVERARIDNLVASAVAPADADANYLEVVDLRAGADGVVYGSAGTAVREQIRKVKREFDNYVRFVSNNLVDISAVTYGYYVDFSNGALIENEDTSCTEMIAIKPNTDYTYSVYSDTKPLGQLAYYDDAGIYISGVSNVGVRGSITLTSPENAHYMRWTINPDYMTVAAIFEGKVVRPYESYKEYIPSEYLEGKTVEVGVGCKYESILRALKETDDDTAVYIHPGVYNIVEEYKEYYGASFWTEYAGYDGVEDKFYRGLWLARGRKLIGISNAVLLFDYSGDNEDVSTYFSVISNDADVLVENLKIKVNRNCRYHIHDDFQPNNGTVVFRNMVFDGRPNTPVFIGGGIGKNVAYHIDRCVFLNDESAIYDISYHGNTTTDTNLECQIEVTGCYGSAGCAFRWYGPSTKETLCKVSGSRFSKIECVAYDESQTVKNMKLVAWNNDV